MTQAFMLGNFGLGEIGIVVVILLLLFGAKRIPQVARALGSSIGEFKKGRREGERKDEKPSIQKTAEEAAKGSDSSHAGD